MKLRVSASPDKRPSCLGARLSGCVPQSVAWGPHLKPRVGRHPDKHPAAWAHRQKAPGWACNRINVWLPLHRDPKQGIGNQPKSKAEIGHTT